MKYGCLTRVPVMQGIRSFLCDWALLILSPSPLEIMYSRVYYIIADRILTRNDHREVELKILDQPRLAFNELEVVERRRILERNFDSGNSVKK